MLQHASTAKRAIRPLVACLLFVASAALHGCSEEGRPAHDGASHRDARPQAETAQAPAEAADPPNALDEFEACGGDPAGDWNLTSLSFGSMRGFPPFERAECRELPRAVRQVVGGGMSFDDGQAKLTATYSSYYDYTLDATCLSALIEMDEVPSDESCADFGARVQAIEREVLRSVCRLVGETCECTFIGYPGSIGVDSSFLVQEGELVFDKGGTNTFCVRDDELQLYGASGDTQLLLGFDRPEALATKAEAEPTAVSMQSLVGIWKGTARSQHSDATLELSLLADTSGVLIGGMLQSELWVTDDGVVLGYGIFAVRDDDGVLLHESRWSLRAGESSDKLEGQLFVSADPFHEMDVELTKEPLSGAAAGEAINLAPGITF